MTLSLPQKFEVSGFRFQVSGFKFQVKIRYKMKTRYNNIQKLNITTMIDCFNPSRNVAPNYNFGCKNKQVQTYRHLG